MAAIIYDFFTCIGMPLPDTHIRKQKTYIHIAKNVNASDVREGIFCVK